MRAKDAVGRYGEDLAVRHLVERGFAVVARNWRTRDGEIDVVALDGPALVVVEVKTRRGEAYGDPLEAVTRVKLARLRRLAAAYVVAHVAATGQHVPEVRIDAVAVLIPPRGAPTVRHVRGVA